MIIEMEIIENEYVKFWKKEGLLFSKHKKTTCIGVKEAEEIIELRHKISNNTAQYWCMDVRHLILSTNDAHHYVDENGQDLVHACAIVVNSFLNRFIVEVFLNVKKPKVPVKVFSSEENAVAWLKELKDSNNAGINLKFKEDQLS